MLFFFSLSVDCCNGSFRTMTVAYISQSSLLEKVHEKNPSTLLFFHTLVLKLHTFSPHCSSFECFKKLFLACFQLQTGSQELVCLLRGSDIFALQEVQLQHHQILQMLDWFGLSSLACFSQIKESL